MTSPWTESESFTLRFVTPPAVLLKLPEEDQYATVSQVLLAVQVDAYITSDTSYAFVVNRTNVREGGEEWCPTMQWRVAANETSTSSPSGTSTVGLIQSRILIANFPGNDFVKPGCNYDITCEQGLFVTVDTPAKTNPEFRWNFSYIDPSPVRAILTLNSVQAVANKGIQVTFQVQYDLASQINCTVAAVSPDSGALEVTGRVSTGAVREPIYASIANRTEGEYLVYDATLTDITVTALVPSKSYTFNCAGWKQSKSWVPAVCANYPSDCEAYSFVTSTDTSTDLDALAIAKVAHCPDGTQATISSETQTFQQVETGIVVLLSTYERACNNVVMAVGEVATITVNFTAGRAVGPCSLGLGHFDIF